MATATRTIKGFKVECPMCHDGDATVSLDLNDIRTLTCSACDQTFSPEKARDVAAAQLRQWEGVCRWIEMAADAPADPE